MTMKVKTNKTILTLYPNTMGMCYALFDSPNDLVDYRVGHVRPVNNRKSIAKVTHYLDYYKPDIVIVRGLTKYNCKNNKRNKKLIDLICKKANEKNLEVLQYNRSQIKEVFNQFEAATKYQISKKLIEWFPKLEALEYPYRKEWMSENHNVGVFDAISLGIIHFYLNG